MKITVADNDMDNWTFPSSIDSNIAFTPTSTLPINSPPVQSQPVCRSSRVCRAVDRFGPCVSYLGGGECGKLY